MSRNPRDFEDETPLPPHGHAPPMAHGAERYLPCHRCAEQTHVATLTQYGAMCFGCYEAYCREPQPNPEFMGDKRNGPHDWAEALRKREESGEHLTLFQKTCWREALGLPITGAISGWEQTPEEYVAGHPNPPRRAA